MLTKQIETYLYSKKILIRDTIMVLIPISIAIAYLIVVVIMGIDLAPGSDYLKSVFMNFLGPLVLIGIGGLVYQVALITDAIIAEPLCIFSLERSDERPYVSLMFVQLL